jgi:hypothetical protein
MLEVSGERDSLGPFESFTPQPESLWSLRRGVDRHLALLKQLPARARYVSLEKAEARRVEITGARDEGPSRPSSRKMRSGAEL